MDSSETTRALSRRHALQTAISLAGVVAYATTQQPPSLASAAPVTPSSAAPSPQRPELDDLASRGLTLVTAWQLFG